MRHLALSILLALAALDASADCLEPSDFPGAGGVSPLRVERRANGLAAVTWSAGGGYDAIVTGSLEDLREGRPGVAWQDRATSGAVVDLPEGTVFILVASQCGTEWSSFGRDSFGNERPRIVEPCDAACQGATRGTTVGECAAVVELAQGTQAGDVIGPVSSTDWSCHVVLLQLTLEWCFPCRLNAPEVEDLYRDYADDGLIVVEVMAEDVMGDPATLASVETYAGDLGVTYPVLVDESYRVTHEWLSRVDDAFPSSWVIGRDGVITDYFRGRQVTAQRAAIERELNR